MCAKTSARKVHPHPPPLKYPSRARGWSKEGVYKIPATSGFKIYDPPPTPYKWSAGQERGEGGGAYIPGWQKPPHTPKSLRQALRPKDFDNGTPSALPLFSESLHSIDSKVTVGFLYGAGAETLIFVTGTSGKYPKLFGSRQAENQSQLWIPRKPRKIGVWVSGAEIQTSAVDTRTAVWVSTAEKIFKIVLGKTRNSSRKFRGVSAPALYKSPAVRKYSSSELMYLQLRILSKITEGNASCNCTAARRAKNV